MRRGLTILLALMLSGCSTAPVADFLDWVHPGKLPAGQYHGGVEATPTIALPAGAVPVEAGPVAPPPQAGLPPTPPTQWPTAPVPGAPPPPPAPGPGNY
jgi:hypothetical protein